jgi:glutamate/tyrosine decarboxylase-like PLP-dependent enzyme
MNDRRDALPDSGRTPLEILAELGDYGGRDPDYRHGRAWSLVYWLDEHHDEFLSQAYRAYSSANGLNPTAFRSLKRFESEIIAAVARLLHGPPTTCGVVTSGGTESCLLAVKTYRDLARKTRGVRDPEMILPATAHVAWFKASEYFDVAVRLLPLDDGFRLDIRGLERLIRRNTVMILGSAPEYPHGLVDPIGAMGAIAARHGVPMHVDACVGGFILPFMEMNGAALSRWDYRVPGVTSISADLHKYGYASKGASTITYRSLELLKHQMFVHQDWPGGVFASPALLGTRPGGAYAAAWAALQYFGTAGYCELARRTLRAFSQLRTGIEAMPELRIYGDPQGPLLSYGARDPGFSIYAVGDLLEARGWHVNRVQFPAGLHAMVTAKHADSVSAFLADLRDAVAAVKADPSLARRGHAATYGLMANVPLRGMVRRRVLEVFAGMYAPGGTAIDIDAADAVESTGGSVRTVTRRQSLVERLILWWSTRN